MSMADLDSDTRRSELDARAILVTLFALLLAPLAAALDNDAVTLAFGGLDAFLLAHTGRAFLPAHAIGMGGGGQHRSHGHRAGERKRAGYDSHVQLLLLMASDGATAVGDVCSQGMQGRESGRVSLLANPGLPRIKTMTASRRA